MARKLGTKKAASESGCAGVNGACEGHGAGENCWGTRPLSCCLVGGVKPEGKVQLFTLSLSSPWTVSMRRSIQTKLKSDLMIRNRVPLR